MSEVDITKKYLTYEEMSDEQRKRIISDALCARQFTNAALVRWFSIDAVLRPEPPAPKVEQYEFRQPKKGERYRWVSNNEKLSDGYLTAGGDHVGKSVSQFVIVGTR